MSHRPSPQRLTRGLGPRTAWRALALGWLLAALLVAPSLGLLHRTVHGAGVPAAPAGLAAEVHGAADAAAPAPAHGCDLRRHPQALQAPCWLERLFGVHDHAGDCRLFDQASSSPGAPAAALAVGALLLPALPGPAPASVPARGPSLRAYHARAPPALRPI